MVAHTVIRQEVAATVEDTFDLIHDYPRRLERDTPARRQARRTCDPPHRDGPYQENLV